VIHTEYLRTLCAGCRDSSCHDRRCVLLPPCFRWL